MLKLAYLHVLPLEYYPPATNFLDLAVARGDVMVFVYSMENRKRRQAYARDGIRIWRFRLPSPRSSALVRHVMTLWWPLRTAISLWRFHPDAVFYVEPHSAPAAWIYLRLLRGRARLFVHHHEYYEPVDYDRRGMRLAKWGRHLEQTSLFRRAEWISQTNPDRLRLAKGDHPRVEDSRWRILPNYPPASWSAVSVVPNPASARARLVYLGSASFEETYIREIVEWVAARPTAVELTICGYNIADDVWEWLDRRQYSNVRLERRGRDYAELPAFLRGFDIGLVLYKGNTTNFIYNIPNKVFEYMRCGLAVWYPTEMAGMVQFSRSRELPTVAVDYRNLSQRVPDLQKPILADLSGLTAECAFAPLLEQLVLKARTP